MVTEARNIGADLIGHLHNHLAFAGFDRFAVDFYVDNITAHAAASEDSWTMLRP